MGHVGLAELCLQVFDCSYRYRSRGDEQLPVNVFANYEHKAQNCDEGGNNIEFAGLLGLMEG